MVIVPNPMGLPMLFNNLSNRIFPQWEIKLNRRSELMYTRSTKAEASKEEGPELQGRVG